MKILRIKMTAARTNPQQIRSIRINSEKNVGELLKVANVVFEYEEVKSVLANESGSKLSDEVKLEDILHVGDFLTVKYDDKNTTDIYMEILEELETDEEAVPLLERYRTVPRRHRERTFYYSVYNQDSIEEFKRYVNRQLTRAFSEVVDVPDFEWTIARPWKSFLDDCTVAELKDIIKENGFQINMNQRKDVLKKGIVSSFACESTFAEIMDELDISEYFSFKELCISGVDIGDYIEDTFPVLSKSFLISKNYWSETMVASEFMRFYETWLESGNERRYFLKHAEKICLFAACHLYGFADKDLLCELYYVLNPDMIQKEKASEIWNRTLKCKTGNDIKLVKSGELYYDATSMKESSAKELHSRFNLLGRLHYTPTIDEIINIAVYGIEIPDEDGQKLFSIMRNKYYLTPGNIEFVIRELVTAIRNSYSNEELIQYLQKILSSTRRTTKFDDIIEILDHLQQKIRKIDLGGYTKEEYDKIKSDSRIIRLEKKTYPNAPCPCGSGKKYKNCCGRR